MHRFKTVFGKKRVVLPVIHVEHSRQALRNAQIAHDAGCPGVFLINHGMPYQQLLEIHHQVAGTFPDWWIGVNCLDLYPDEVFGKIGPRVRGVWVDNAMIDERREMQCDAQRILLKRKLCGWQGLYFGGVAFKYQRQVSDLHRAAALATPYMDVVTTSGPGTGYAASREKIQALREALGDFPLAIASGITPENIYDYLDLADCFLVATGISKSFTDLDPDRVKALMGQVDAYNRGFAAGIGQSAGKGAGRGLSVCFVCEWNEGRSAHLELSARHKLREAGSRIQVSSAGFSQGGGVSATRFKFLRNLGIDVEEIASHRSTIFNHSHANADLVLVAEKPMQDRLLKQFPQLAGKVMTIRGFIMGQSPGDEVISREDAHIEDAGGHPLDEKLVLYGEIEELTGLVVKRLLEL